MDWKSNDSHNNDDLEYLSIPLKPPSFKRASVKFRQFIHKNDNLSPYLSGDSFAALADYAAFGSYGTRSFDPFEAKRASSIFVKADRLEDFISEGESHKITPDVVITGNSDRNFELPTRQPLNCKLWICQNNAMPERPGLLTLPIGLENKRHGRLGQTKFYSPSQRRRISETTKVLVPPMSPTNPNRVESVRQALLRTDIYEVQREYMPANRYFKGIRDFQFVLCLEGNGFDTHRIWECLYLNIFPVVVNSAWAKSLQKFNLPIMYINSIQDISRIELENFLEVHQGADSDSSDVLWTPYWEKLVRLYSVSKAESSFDS
jgi:hypothetical protein